MSKKKCKMAPWNIETAMLYGKVQSMGIVYPYKEEKMSYNPWQLYESVPGWEQVHAALEQGWQVAKEFSTSSDARKYMHYIMQKHSSFGADDTEPRAELESRLDAEGQERLRRWQS